MMICWRTADALLERLVWKATAQTSAVAPPPRVSFSVKPFEDVTATAFALQKRRKIQASFNPALSGCSRGGGGTPHHQGDFDARTHIDHWIQIDGQRPYGRCVWRLLFETRRPVRMRRIGAFFQSVGAPLLMIHSEAGEDSLDRNNYLLPHYT